MHFQCIKCKKMKIKTLPPEAVYQELGTSKKGLSAEDLKINSPYNTYVNAGLPPEPICNPSLSALKAVANADPSTPYLFYLTGNDNKMHYAKTLDEHNSNIAKYLR